MDGEKDSRNGVMEMMKAGGGATGDDIKARYLSEKRNKNNSEKKTCHLEIF